MEGLCVKPVLAEPFSDFLRGFGSGHINDGRTFCAIEQVPQGLVFILIGSPEQNSISKISAGDISRETLQGYPKPVPEIVANVADHLRFRGRSETGDRNRSVKAFTLLKMLDELPDEHIFNPEVLPPSGEAMRLVNHDSDQGSGHQNLLDGLGAELLRGDVKQRGLPGLDPLQSVAAFNRRQQAIDIDGFRDSFLLQILHLILHQGLER